MNTRLMTVSLTASHTRAYMRELDKEVSLPAPVSRIPHPPSNRHNCTAYTASLVEDLAADIPSVQEFLQCYFIFQHCSPLGDNRSDGAPPVQTSLQCAVATLVTSYPPPPPPLLPRPLPQPSSPAFIAQSPAFNAQSPAFSQPQPAFNDVRLNVLRCWADILGTHPISIHYHPLLMNHHHPLSISHHHPFSINHHPLLINHHPPSVMTWGVTSSDDGLTIYIRDKSAFNPSSPAFNQQPPAFQSTITRFSVNHHPLSVNNHTL